MHSFSLSTLLGLYTVLIHIFLLNFMHILICCLWHSSCISADQYGGKEGGRQNDHILQYSFLYFPKGAGVCKAAENYTQFWYIHWNAWSRTYSSSLSARLGCHLWTVSLLFILMLSLLCIPTTVVSYHFIPLRQWSHICFDPAPLPLYPKSEMQNQTLTPGFQSPVMPTHLTPLRPELIWHQLKFKFFPGSWLHPGFPDIWTVKPDGRSLVAYFLKS